MYGLITGYGESGPDADRAAFDVAAFWSRAGVAHLLTRPGDTPRSSAAAWATIRPG